MRGLQLLVLSFLPRMSAADARTDSVQELDSVPLLVGVGVSSFVPIEAHGAVTALDASVSTEMGPWTTLGLRLSLAMNPVEAPQGPSADRAWAAILEVRNRLGIGEKMDPMVVIGGGFVVGDRDGSDVSNLVLPYGQIGVGLHLVIPKSDNGVMLYIDPELGIVPGVLYDRGVTSVVAPYSAVRIGIRLP